MQMYDSSWPPESILMVPNLGEDSIPIETTLVIGYKDVRNIKKKKLQSNNNKERTTQITQLSACELSEIRFSWLGFYKTSERILPAKECCLHASSELFSCGRGGEHTMAVRRKGQLARQPSGQPRVLLSTWAALSRAEQYRDLGCSRNGSLHLLSLAQLWTVKPPQCSAPRNLKLKWNHPHGWGICTISNSQQVSTLQVGVYPYIRQHRDHGWTRPALKQVWPHRHCSKRELKTTQFNP